MDAEGNVGSSSIGTAGRRPGHFEFLDSLRGLAALWVVLFHLTISATLPPVDDGGAAGMVWNGLLGRGALGVAVFFVISGFVIAHALRGGLDSGGAFRTFLVRRVVRLSPPYWAAIVLAIAVHGLASVVNDEPFAPGGHPLTVGRVLSHVVYLEGLLGHPYINDVFWTLTVEMQFYLVLAVILAAAGYLGRRFRHGFRAVVWATMALSVVAARSGADPQASFVPLFYSFLLGAVLYWSWSKRLSEAEMGAYLLALGIVYGVEPDAFLAASLGTGILLLMASWWAHGLTNWLSGRAFGFLGRISYSLYLVHVPVQGAVLLAVTRVMGTGPGGVVAAAAASTVASIGAATVFWWAVERPAMGWASALRRPSSTEPAPAVAFAGADVITGSDGAEDPQTPGPGPAAWSGA